MRKRAIIIILLLLAILSFCVPSFSQSLTEEKIRVAVVEFGEKGDLGIPDAGEIIAEWVIAALVETGKYVIEERPLLEKVLEERQLALADIYELKPESLARLRDEYKVDVLLLGSIMKFLDSISIVGKLVDVRSFEVIRAKKVSTTEAREIEQKVEELVWKLAGVNRPPVIASLIAERDVLEPGETTTITCTAADPDKDTLSYVWSTIKGSIQGQGEKLIYRAPDEPGTYSIKVSVSDNNGGEDSKEITIKVEEQTGSLKITSNPSGADIYLDQAYKGKTPLSLSNIEVGSYTVKAVKGEQIKEETVYVRGKEATSLEFSFAPLDMVLIPAGEFLMGSNEGTLDEQPIHKVYLDAYYIDKYEVTNAQFSKFLNEKGNQEEGRVTWLDINDKDCLIEYRNGKYQPKSGYENHPVIEVSWYGARAYAKWAGKRLPTEAEWEKAARGGLVGKKYPWGDSIDSSKANYGSNVGHTTPEGSYPPNGYGLYDMAGNVWEWVSDWYDRNYYSQRGPSRNPQGSSNDSYHVYRDGGWGDDTSFLRCANRGYAFAVSRYYDLGFRCVKSA